MKLYAWRCWAWTLLTTASAVRQTAVVKENGEVETLQLRKENGDLKLRLENFDNVQYSAAFSLGDQTLPVIYDTGSFEIIVLSTLCMSCSRAHQVYNSSRSASFVADRSVIAEHLFGSGPVRSQKGYETVRLGGQGSPYVAEHTPIWQVMSHDIEVWDHTAHFSGIVGLGHPGQVPEEFSPEGKDDAADSMLRSMHVTSFALCLERRRGAPGWLLLGPSVKALPTIPGAGFQKLQVVGRVHWGLQMTDLTLPGVLPADRALSPNNPCSPSCGAIVDSGTSLLAAPPSALGLVRSLQRLLRRDCSNLRELPNIRMKLDGKLIELPPSSYVMKTRTRVYRNSSVLKRLFSGPDAHKTVDRCSIGFMTLDKQSQYGPVWILGMPFLRHYYTVFHRKDKTIHIAPSTGSCEIVGGAQHQLGSFVANSTHLFQGGQTAATSETAAASSRNLVRAEQEGDFEPTEVDVNSLMMPPWALEEKERVVSF